jgi:hypothetical protein
LGIDAEIPEILALEATSNAVGDAKIIFDLIGPPPLMKGYFLFMVMALTIRNIATRGLFNVT